MFLIWIFLGCQALTVVYLIQHWVRMRLRIRRLDVQWLGGPFDGERVPLDRLVPVHVHRVSVDETVSLLVVPEQVPSGSWVLRWPSSLMT